MTQSSNSGSIRDWESHWAKNDTPWDAGRSAPALGAFIKQWSAEHSTDGARALIPGCGRGHDVFELASAGLSSWGLDIAPSAKPYFETERATKSEAVAKLSHLVVGDFFEGALDSSAEPFDLIWDYTFLCAIDLKLRPNWKKRMIELLAHDGTLVTLLFPVLPDANPDVGPPYPLNPNDIASFLAPEFILDSLNPVTESHPGREGKEFIATWKRNQD